MNKRLLCLFMAIMMIFSCAMPVGATAVSGGDVSASDTASVADTPTTVPPQQSLAESMSAVNAADIVDDINLGWNLGESLDSWARDAGYDEYHNSNAYQLILRYDNAEGERSVSIPTQFNEKNKATYKWTTGLIDTDPDIGLGDIGFEIWNLTLEEDTEVTIKVTKALLTRRTGVAYDIPDLLGTHTITITKYGTTAVLSTQFPSQLTRTYGITDGTFEVTVELVDFPQKEYNKSAYFETLWNNPRTSYEMIEEVRRAGFNCVRIPVTYYNHTVSDTNVIDTQWLDRVQEVVDYAYYQGMYVILDMHNDGSSTGWLTVNASDSDAVRTRFSSLWTQIANRFADYDERLLFQGFNEIINEEEVWDTPSDSDLQWVNSLNQLFVDTVRATGGGNAQRCLVLSPYAGSHEQGTIDGFKLPTDSARNKLIVGITAYAPAEFVYSIDEETTSFTDVYEWGAAEQLATVRDIFSRLNRRFVSAGTPVIVTEFCSADKGNAEDRAEHAAYYIKTARENGIACCWWDDGGLFLRSAFNWSCPELLDSMVNASSLHLSHAKIEGLGEHYYTGEKVIPQLTITVSQSDVFTYRGEAPINYVSDSDGGVTGIITLVEGVDYEVFYADNIELGTAHGTISGIGRCSGIIDVEFTIVEEPRPIDALTILAGENPQLPFVIMISIPMLAVLGFYAVYRMIKRREAERIDAVVSAAMAEEMGGESIFRGDGAYDNNQQLADYLDEGEYDNYTKARDGAKNMSGYDRKKLD